MNRVLLASVGIVAAIASNSVAEAQRIRVGPLGGVNVRLPYTSVNVLPFGLGTQVRAPFTSVNTRAFALGYGSRAIYRPPVYYDYRYYPAPRVAPVYHTVPVYPAPIYPAPIYPAPIYHSRVYVPAYRYPYYNAPIDSRSNYQTARPIVTHSSVVHASFDTVPTDQVPERLRSAALALKESISQRKDDGDIWLDYLSPEKIVDTVDENQPPNRLREVLSNFEGVLGNTSLVSIQSARGFRETHQLLRQFVGDQDGPSAENATSIADDDDDSTSLLTPMPDTKSKEPTPASPIRSAVEPEDVAPQEAKPDPVDEFEFNDELPAPRTSL